MSINDYGLLVKIGYFEPSQRPEIFNFNGTGFRYNPEKSNELYAHYGPGYWLLAMGVSPIKVSELDKEFGGFNKFYKH